MFRLPRLTRPPLLRTTVFLRLASPRATFSTEPANPRISSVATAAAAAVSDAIVGLVAAGGRTLEADLDRLGPALSHPLVSATLRALTDRGVPAAGFFDWVALRRGFSPSAHAHNLLVDNAGRLADYQAMSRALASMSARRIPLIERAFAFLNSSRGNARDTAIAILRTLDEVGGPCRASGVFSLVKALASIGEFDAAMFVIQETAKEVRYYNALMAVKCKAGDFHGAREVFDGMRRSGFDPNANSWNYLLGCLLKNGRFAEGCELVETMERSGPDDIPNSLTYEILAYHACKAGRMDSATQIVDQMFLEKLTPRITIHTAFIKGFLCTGRIEDACRYVSAMSTRDRHSVNRNYSLLARLLCKTGRIVDAGRILYELMEKKGLLPDHSAYIRVIKDLYKVGKGDLATELKLIFHKLSAHAGSAQ
ncbi:pentatricopeptide repeat-containing protein At3g62470, mitochondrial-like [Oryza brachyantha]|uniref:Pentacotripeptide-repeat region of PRORP domain-containing protein n=1 Tax=Oryza brachyantha TaxID=4533 RepID=J3LJC3_ORYBR|nr:pentatricopeptide repeat-containing protein At3g62470, mitochondrial-like [Oryza brachyantha]